MKHRRISEPEKRRRRVVAVFFGVISAGSALLLGGLATSVAFLDDSETVSPNKLAAGTVEITLTKDGTVAAEPFDVDSMTPGTTATKAFLVENTGDVDLRYRVSIADLGSNNLSGALVESIHVTGDGGGEVSGTGQAGLANGYVLGNTADQERVLQAGESDTVTVALELPSSVTSAVAGLSTTFDLVIAAEQTAGNAFAALP